MLWKHLQAEVSPELVQLIENAVAVKKPHPILDSTGMGHQRIIEFIGADGLRTASRFSAACAVNPKHSPALHHAANVLPAGLFTVLVLVCAARIGFGEVERTMGWPSRSAKLVLAMALDEAVRRRVV